LAQTRTLDSLRANDRGGGRHDCIVRISGFAGRIGRRQYFVADEVYLRGNGDVEQGAVVLGGDVVDERQRKISLWRSIRDWISSSVAPGPRTSEAGKSTCLRSWAP
jgi:hypothetical protein